MTTLDAVKARLLESQLILHGIDVMGGVEYAHHCEENGERFPVFKATVRGAQIDRINNLVHLVGWQKDDYTSIYSIAYMTLKG